jgi:hypothetical protein
MAEIRRRFAMARQQKQQHVASLLPFVLPGVAAVLPAEKGNETLVK